MAWEVDQGDSCEEVEAISCVNIVSGAGRKVGRKRTGNGAPVEVEVHVVREVGAELGLGSD